MIVVELIDVTVGRGRGETKKPKWKRRGAQQRKNAKESAGLGKIS